MHSKRRSYNPDLKSSTQQTFHLGSNGADFYGLHQKSQQTHKGYGNHISLRINKKGQAMVENDTGRSAELAFA